MNKCEAMRKIIRNITVFALVGITCFANAQSFPTKPLRIVVPFSPGGATDALSRMLAQQLTARIGQPVIVDNRPGASEQVAATFVKNSLPDGHTIMLSTMGGMTVNPSLFGSKLSYDPQKDFKPVILAAILPNVLFVNPTLPVNSVDELTAYAKKNPGTLSYGSSGAGQPTHLAMEVYKHATGVDVVHVPYKGGAPALQDLMSGQVQLMIAVGAESMPYARAGKLKALAVANLEKTPLYPDLPPMSASTGLAGFNIPIWFCYVAPAGTPNEIVTKLNQLLNGVLQEKSFRSKMAEMGMEAAGGTPEALASLIKTDTERWRKVIEQAGVKLD
jgi:tripartite-type tricarboxylate transporter receptor subunit TctC